ncbi:sugar ABC transporter ATP-binding protein [Aliifodinibius sp. S!AR15-10]|uniref:sugar ABC transporter ATP-binding protein n=1 Tax=Aliifodinibius sp. S!AR15-10 TaxID=2950437 RepID=UPI0028650B88|nr:sugar ABC transporter ATP-binding protein [Aliifodinibius sp. S!AR15-10]MDR8392703.1 sugar ABC transporter ATP-binding protein [Aliifodinibius sp. S!AR15-10]
MNLEQQCILQVRNLSKSFGGVQALDNVQFEAKEGEVHGLMGENGAGKSTLMNILVGLIKPDTGKIIFQGETLQHSDVRGTIDRGISMVHQEIMPIPELTVAQNIYLGQEMVKIPGWVDENRIIEHAEQQLRELEVDIDVTRQMKHLGVAEMQMVEIAKALSNEAKIIIMDEPTSSLSNKEVDNLFRVINTQKKKGVTIIYISHRMEEIFRICDTVTVLRDGHYIDTKPAKELDEDTLIEMMVGRELEAVFPDKNRNIGDVVFSVKRLGSKEKFRDISFELRRGEVLGFAGLMGAGRTDIVQSIMGLKPLNAGQIYLNGNEVNVSSPRDAIRLGISYVTEDRKGSGIVQDLSVRENLTLSSLRQFSSKMFVNKTEEHRSAGRMIDDLRIKTPNMQQKVKFLSGGNQQKVVIGKSLLASPEVLILDEPTRGIDVGAKFEIYQLIDQLAREGKAILLISSELPELLGLSHRILVLSRGRVTAELKAGEATQELIMKHAIQN